MCVCVCVSVGVCACVRFISVRMTCRLRPCLSVNTGGYRVGLSQGAESLHADDVRTRNHRRGASGCGSSSSGLDKQGAREAE